MTYEEVKKIRENPTVKDVDNKELQKMIDNAVEKQIPKNVCFIIRESGIKKGYCPICKLPVSRNEDVHYCGTCGNSLNWSV